MAHGLMITRRDIEHAHRIARRASRDEAKKHDMKEHAMKSLRVVSEVGLAAFGMGVVKGYYGPVSIGGKVPIDLLAFVALAGLGAAGVGGKYAEDVLNFGVGFGAGYLHTLGAGVGTSMGLKAGKTPFATTKSAGIAGALGTGNAPLTDAELAALAHAA